MYAHCLGHRKCHRYATPGERQQHRVASETTITERRLVRQHPSCIGPIQEALSGHHHQSPTMINGEQDQLAISVEGDQPWWAAIAVR